MFEELGKLDKTENSGIAVYFQLANIIRTKIEKRELVAGDLIESERKVATRLNISVGTVRKAYEDLVQKGFLKRVQGKGTYVASTADRLKKVRYYPLVDNFKDKVQEMDSELLGLSVVSGTEEINNNLEIAKNEKLYRVERLLTLSGVKTIYCDSYLPCKMFPTLEEYDAAYFEKYALFIFLERELGVSTINNKELISIAMAGHELADLLDVEAGTPVLQIEKLMFTHKAIPYEYRKSYCAMGKRKLRRIY